MVLLEITDAFAGVSDNSRFVREAVITILLKASMLSCFAKDLEESVSGDAAQAVAAAVIQSIVKKRFLCIYENIYKNYMFLGYFIDITVP